MYENTTGGAPASPASASASNVPSTGAPLRAAETIPCMISNFSAQSHVAEAAKHLKETDVPLTHGYARLVINRTIDELHAILNCLDDAVVAAKD